MSRPRANSSPRRARFEEDGAPAGIDHELMRAAFESQASVQAGLQQPNSHASAHEQQNSQPPPPQSSSPFMPGYSVCATNDAQRSQLSALAEAVSPLERSPDPASTSSATGAPQGKPSTPKRAGFAEVSKPSEDSDGDDDESGEEFIEPLRTLSTCKGRRGTSAFIPDLPSDGNEDYVRAPAPAPQKYAAAGHSTQQAARPQYDGRPPLALPRNGASGQQKPRPPPMNLPQRPAPTAHSPYVAQHGFTSRPVSGVYDANAQSQMPSFSGTLPWGGPQPLPSPGAQIQHYDPYSSPSMVQPFSPRVTSSGSIRSPALKPALVRRDQSVENFAIHDSGDPMERGAVRAVEPEATRRPYGITQALVGLYGAATASGDGTEGLGVRMPNVRRRSSASLGGDTLNGVEGTIKGKGTSSPGEPAEKEAELAYKAPSNVPSLARRRQSMAFTLGEDDVEMDPDDPRLTHVIRKSMQAKRQREAETDYRRASWSSEMGDPDVPVRRRQAPRRRSSMGAIKNFVSGRNSEDQDDKYTATRRKSFDRRKSTTTITANVAHVVFRQKFILKLAKALMLFGAPSHRIESQLNATANVLEVDAQFIHFPGIVIASFGDVDKHTSETHFVKSKSDLSLGALHDVHQIYRKVVHDDIGVQEGTEELNALLKAEACWGEWARIGFAAVRCWLMAPMSFGGSFIDAFAAAAFGAGLTFLQLRVTRKNAMYSNVFEISTAILISFIARGLSTTGIFCYQSIASSGLILVLPGYVILCGSLELASKNMIAGSVRMVYAIIYSLFLGFGIAIGSDFYFLLDPAARNSMYVPLEASVKVDGTFSLANATMPLWTGTFEFTNGTQRNALTTGSINCERLPDWPWYRQPISPWFNFIFVPLFSLLSCFNLLQPLRSWNLPVMVFIACVGWTANMTANRFVFNRSDVVSAIGSFIIGILGNVYSRIFRGTAFTATAVAVLFLVPSGMAMAGGLAMTYKGSDGDLYSNGLTIGLRMVSVAIGITVGLFGSALVVYSFGRRKGGALFAF
ncbi:PHEROMONE-REGULATED MEMBRANE PROTEIN 10 [Ceraceosorus bombacis]|uniref:PHEROMONE-REGULATED MEMBRANE PROTEIN 10 n=1 Tax=Ceraceosorus bombacis TaxID=401625 RepID=A0A0P1BFS7_9BASI|nr:PHEROMONE-REGULATED MEMBRANE PROTEIN 10 [Ceraceosorus bombacis]